MSSARVRLPLGHDMSTTTQVPSLIHRLLLTAKKLPQTDQKIFDAVCLGGGASERARLELNVSQTEFESRQGAMLRALMAGVSQ